MRSSLAGLLMAAAAWAQEARLDVRSSVKIDLPADSPVALISANMGESRASARGGAMMLDLNMQLMLRNVGGRSIRGLTLLVQAQEVTPGGRASATQTSLDVVPGATFPVAIDVRLLRPLDNSGGPLVEVALDGLLFDDLNFYGPNRLESRRALTAWELEAQRDRKHFKAVLAAEGPEGLQRRMLDSLARQEERPRIDVVVARGQAVGSAAVAERRARFAFLKLPEAPVELLAGSAEIAGNQARAPRIEVRNVSPRPVRHVEVGWIVRDREGREFLAGSLAAWRSELLQPGETGERPQPTALRFSRDQGGPVRLEGMTGFVSQVEYGDGSVWVPGRAAIESARLARLLAPSPEEQRLTNLYRSRGLKALIEELKKF